MKKLTYILNQYSHKEGSHFYAVIGLLEEIAKYNVKITLIIEKSEDTPNFKSKNINVILQKKTGIRRSIELFMILKNLHKQGYCKTFVRVSQNGAIPAILASKIYGGEVYYWQSGTTYITEIKKSFNLGRYLKSELPFKFVKKFTTYFVTGPEYMVEYYEKYVQVKKSKILCLYNDVDTKRFSPVSKDEATIIKSELKIDLESKIILFVHRMSPVRRTMYYMPKVLIKTLDDCTDCICYVIGGGSDKELLDFEIKKHNMEGRIILMGQIPNKEIEKFYRISDVFINPSYTEGFSRVLVESMASGLPMVVTNAGGTKDIIGKLQSEFMVDIDDVDGFSKKLKLLINSKETRGRLSIENIQQSKRFSTQNIAKMYVNTIFTDE
ncbi:glycosyl transferase group 1 [uncultured Candidatus Thioglobus sp.]|nr:glycosyl transferase group 1 [uncultured Candidatus Thioglobus sp.]